MLPYQMGTTNPKLFHLFGVDRVVVEEAIATLEATIQAWNQDGSMIVGHPIVCSFRDTKIEPSNNQPLPRGPASLPPSPLIHHSEFMVPWTLLETVADIL
jgi:hypothetical protein